MRRHSAHVDENVLAELGAGLISDRRATRIHAHLAGCQRCAGVSARLCEVSTLLASVPRPAMPGTVTGRLTAAIAAEAAARSDVAVTPVRLAGQEASQPARRAGGGGPPRDRRRGLASPVAVRVFAAAAAVCVVAAGGYTMAQLNSVGGPGRAVTPQPGGIPRQLGPASRTAVAPYNLAPSHTGQSLPGVSEPTFEVVSSGLDYQRATLSTQIGDELAKIRAAGPDSSTGTQILLHPTAQQDGCVQRITSSVQPALVDVARYQGHPATVITLAQQENPVAQAWVVGPRCSADVSDVLAHVWLHPSGG